MEFSVLNSTFFRRTLVGVALSVLATVSLAARAGGVALGATRVIYSAGATQTSLAVTNTDTKNPFLIQSWVEDANGEKSANFVVTPPLFVAKPSGENILRIMYVGAPLPTDRESVYWMNVKAIPSVDRNAIQDKNVLQLAVLSRIKLFVRPVGLPQSPADAPTQLRFHRQGDSLTINNPTPYFVTLVNFNMGTRKLPNTMVPPKGNVSVSLPADARGEVIFQSINDYGANSARTTGIMQ
ncbi:fimbria/pilus periplasmic chaperone [Affinibrenneria salicis]|uniref:Fimbria/pilus periplasmic chaperone n=1 Tax=Affinibrenneria salicis TaxID=2590031 RepID=A0A5J5FRY3_9GAMM|nr:fimbria/pilus periplasmic chaperone [Affinibrenneria salicis]KAA8995402.1 fimbria/pilus periplasmic chaperone [Affinibrenneria salicis]